MLIPTFLAVFLSLGFTTPLVSAHTVSGKILTNSLLPNISSLGPTSRVVLQSLNSYKAHIREDGSFEIYNVVPGSYFLQVLALNYILDSARIDIKDKSKSKKNPIQASFFVPGSSWKTIGIPISYPLELSVLAKNDYFTPREGFSIMSLFANPMLLMSLFTLGMVFVMPKLMGSMDPEMLKEIQEQQRQQRTQMSSIANGDFSGKIAEMLSGSGSKPKEGPPAISNKASKRN